MRVDLCFMCGRTVAKGMCVDLRSVCVLGRGAQNKVCMLIRVPCVGAPCVPCVTFFCGLQKKGRQ